MRKTMSKPKIENKIAKSSNGKILTGIVVSTKMKKTVVVDIERSKIHRLYGKSYRINNRIKARNDFNDISVGDSVTIFECKPFSKTVGFKVDKGNK